MHKAHLAGLSSIIRSRNQRVLGGTAEHQGTAARGTGAAAAAGWDDAGGVALHATRDLENQLGQLWDRGTRP